MNQAAPISRPILNDALAAWKKLLAERQLATELLWIFEENLCFEKKPEVPGGVHIGFQTRFSPVPQESLDIAYEHFCESTARIVFYRLGESKGRSVCILLGDEWFNEKQESDGYVKRDDWGFPFTPASRSRLRKSRTCAAGFAASAANARCTMWTSA